MIIVGLDLSLTSTGVCRISSPARIETVTLKSKTTDNTVPARSLRLRSLTGRAAHCCAGADLVLVEGPAYASDVGKMWDRAGLWWLICARLTGQNIDVIEIPPTVVKTYATGKGNASKDQVLAAVIRRYGDVPVDGNDQADALVLAAIGARLLGQPIDDLPQTHLRALATLNRREPT